MNSANRHLLTFDIEHWYESYRLRGIGGWEDIAPRDHRVVEKLMSLLREHNQTATFFFTGRFAREFPSCVRACADLGHEVASHSDQHQLITSMSGEGEFRRDLQDSLKLLSDITGKPVLGYRAPKWTITPENQDWALAVLAEEGLKYDSSFFPFLGADKARVGGVPMLIKLRDQRHIIEVPATGFNIASLCLPIAGGFYFRLFPRLATLAMLNQKEREGRRGMLYLHPYDLDAECPILPDAGVLVRLFRTYGTGSAWSKLEYVLQKKRFCSISNWLIDAKVS